MLGPPRDGQNLYKVLGQISNLAQRSLIAGGVFCLFRSITARRKDRE